MQRNIFTDAKRTDWRDLAATYHDIYESNIE